MCQSSALTSSIGAAIAGTLWFTLLTALLTRHYISDTLRNAPVLVLGYILLVLLVTILIFSYPSLRFKLHDAFEYTHRYAGWTAVALFWAELLLLTSAQSAQAEQSFRTALSHEPAFYLLILITLNIIWPWLRLRKVQVVAEKLSSHAILIRFPTQLAPFSGYAISDAPLKEWHPFATFPGPEGSSGSSMLVSHAGDWTSRAIDSPKLTYWVKGVPKAGVLSMTCLFRKCVVVTTGSGIGPCLAYLSPPWNQLPCRLLWSTPAPLETYGPQVCAMVRKIDPDAQIIDTRKYGRPNMVQLAYELYVASGAEAVFVISNPLLTRKVVYAMESRGVPAFGPIWDS